MGSVEEATRCIQELNGVVSMYAALTTHRFLTFFFQELNGRRIRVDYSVTDRPHAPTPGEYMGHRRSNREYYHGGRDFREPYRDAYRDRDRERDHRRSDRDRDRDPYGRDNRDWRDRRSPPVRNSRYSPDYRRRRSYSRSPPRGSSPSRARDYDAPTSSAPAPAPVTTENSRW